MAKFGALLDVKNPKFYCQNVCGEVGFSIDEWNKAFRYCEDAGIEGEERDRILSPELFPCKEQCEACINVVLDTQSKNRRIRRSKKPFK